MSVEIRIHELENKAIQYPFEIVELDQLHPHEMTIDYELHYFLNEIKKDMKLWWPIIVDKDSMVVLDGHHRISGLKLMGYNRIPAIMIDYCDNEDILLDTWYPNLSVDPETVIQELKKEGMDIFEISSIDEYLPKVRNREYTAIIGNKHKLYVVQGDRDKIFKLIRDKWLEHIKYHDDPYHCIENTNEGHTAIISWAYTKEEIVRAAKEGNIFLPKTTRHTLKYPPAKFNFPLSKLSG